MTAASFPQNRNTRISPGMKKAPAIKADAILFVLIL
jgi:hypothetical protein